MEKEDKDLLLKDLCGRLPYGVKCTVYRDIDIHRLSGVVYGNPFGELYFKELDWKECDGFVHVEYCKPFLFPLSSLTAKQKQELWDMGWDYILLALSNERIEYRTHFDCRDLIDWLNKNHFDYRGLIRDGLAIDCTNLNIY